MASEHHEPALRISLLLHVVGGQSITDHITDCPAAQIKAPALGRGSLDATLVYLKGALMRIGTAVVPQWSRITASSRKTIGK